jgi:hypothetical protein
MEKLVYLLGDAEAGTIPSGCRALRDRVLESVTQLQNAGASQMTFTVADVEDPDVGKIAQFNNTGLIDGQLSLWLDTIDDRAEIESIVSGFAKRLAGYLVTESMVRDYPAQDWFVGEPSPGVATFTTFPKPKQLGDDLFFARWHGSHGPLSLEIHPLTRYVRNSVARALTPGAPPIRAIVSESVGSASIASDVEIFYRGREGRKRIVKDLLSFAEIESMSSVVMREYILEDKL